MLAPISSTQAPSLQAAPSFSEDQMEQVAEHISMKENFNPYECDILFKALSKEEHKGKVSEWLDLFLKGEKNRVKEEVQAFINQNITAKDLAKIAFLGTAAKLSKMSKKKLAYTLTKEMLSIPVAPLILTYKLGKTLVTEKGRASARDAFKNCLKGRAFKSYNARNKLITALMKASSGALVSGLIAANFASAGALAPLTLALASVLSVTVATKLAHDLANGKHLALSLVQVIRANVTSSALGSIDMGISNITDFCDAMLGALDFSFERALNPMPASTDELEASIAETGQGYAEESLPALAAEKPPLSSFKALSENESISNQFHVLKPLRKSPLITAV